MMARLVRRLFGLGRIVVVGFGFAAAGAWALVAMGVRAGVALLLVIRHRPGTGVRCPRGHVIELTGGPFACGLCGFVYEGHILRCENPECGAPTSYVDCPTCGLSTRNPYRWGNP